MEIAKVYDPKSVEDKWYEFWVKNKYFEAHVKKDKNPYIIVIPPPNITSILHAGHAFNNTMQDIYIRYKRKLGFETLWQPGTDHAGIGCDTGDEAVRVHRQLVFSTDEEPPTRMKPAAAAANVQRHVARVEVVAVKPCRHFAAGPRTRRDDRLDAFVERRRDKRLLAISRVPSQGDALGIDLRQRAEIVDAAAGAPRPSGQD